MLITILSGLAVKTDFLEGYRSKIILLSRKLHRYLGYCGIGFCKINIYVITWGGDFFGFFVFDLLSLLVFLYWKQNFPRMESKNVSLQVNSNLKSIRSVKELNREKQYVVFSNFVYDLSPLKNNHPAGNEIIKYIRNQ